jgi:hypothetical protein
VSSHPTAVSNGNNDEPPLALTVTSPPSPPTSFDPNKDDLPQHGPTQISYDKPNDTRIAPANSTCCLSDDDCISLWCHLATTPDCRATAMISSEVTSSVPPGSLWHPKLEITSDDISDIPLFGFKTFDDAHAHDRSNPTLSNFGNLLATLRQNTLLPFRADMQVNFCWSKSSLADSGANVCIMNDPTLLLGIVQIDQVPLGTAVDTLIIQALTLSYFAHIRDSCQFHSSMGRSTTNHF